MGDEVVALSELLEVLAVFPAPLVVESVSMANNCWAKLSGPMITALVRE